ncbi:anti-sigma factor [Yinghuangia sp. YIM S10712]|uniref:anti-sigma factor n=1 Tax=Yinghuangia sp. YIM S10712 TaxID=3436930 RepID=UPI003F52CCDF
MSHSDPATLALAALGEHVPDSDRTHIATCPVCRAEMDRFQAVVSVGRRLRPDDEPTAPRPDLWQRITDELADELGPEPGNGRPDESTHADATGRAPTAGGTTGPDDASGATADHAVPKRQWFRLRKSLALAASAAVIGATAGVGGTLWANRDESLPPTRIAAETRLAPLPAHQAAGAAFVDTAGGETGRRLVVRVSGLAPQSGFYEVWLLDRDAKNMIAIGLLPVSGEAAFDLPANLDLEGYPVVDVSLQQYNGSPEHSGDSVVRGILPG